MLAIDHAAQERPEFDTGRRERGARACTAGMVAAGALACADPLASGCVVQHAASMGMQLLTWTLRT